MSSLRFAAINDMTHRSKYSVMLYAGTTKVSVFFSCIVFLGRTR